MKLTIKILIWFTGIIITLILLLFLIIRIPSVQNLVLDKTITVLQNKLGSRISIKKITLGLPNHIVLRDFCFEDMNRDTLLAGEVLKVNINLLKIFNNVLQINEVDLQGIVLRINRTSIDSTFNFNFIIKAFSKPPEITVKPDTLSGMTITLNKISLERIKFSFKDDVTETDIRFNLALLKTSFRKSDINNLKFIMPDFNISGVNGSIVLNRLTMNKSDTAIIATRVLNKAADSTLKKHIEIGIGNLEFSDINLTFDDFTKPVKEKGIDYAHLGVTDFNLKANSLSYNTDSISGHIGKANLKSKEGFLLTSLQTSFTYCNTGAILKDLYLETPGTTLMDYLSISYPSLSIIAKDPGKMSIKINLVKSKISISDVLTFVPQLADIETIKKNPYAVINITGNLNGSLAKLNIQNLLISGFENTHINIMGNITGLPDIKRTLYDLTIKELRSGNADLSQIIPSGLIPETIQLPEEFNISGKFNGGMSRFETNLDVATSYGAVKVSAGLQNATQKGNEAFIGTIDLISFNAGKLLKMDTTLGRISLHANIEGTGTKSEIMNAKFSMLAGSTEFKGYTYKDLVLNGNLTNQNLSLSLKMKDQNLQFDLDAKANIINKNPAVTLTLNIDTLDLQKLHLADSAIRFHGNIVANLPSTNPDSLIGTVTASNLLLQANKKLYQLDSINVIAVVRDGDSEVLINSEIITASLTGRYNLAEISSSVTSEINKYFKISDIKERHLSKPQNFTFALKINKHPLIQEFVPPLTLLEPVMLKGSFNNETGGLNMDATIPKIIYSGTSAENIKLIINTSGNALNYDISLGKISTASLKINKTSLKGHVQDNIASANLKIRDQDDKDKYHLAGLFSVVAGQYRFSFNNDSLLLNYETWTVTSENFVQFGPKGIMAGNLNFSGKGQSLSVNSNPQQVNSPLIVDFSNFRVSTLTAIAGLDTLLADGIINGKAEIGNLGKSPSFAGDLNIKDLSFRADTLGDIVLTVNNQVKNSYAAKINITGRGNDIGIEGNYNLIPENKSSFDFDIDIRKLNMSTLDGFTMGNLKDASGIISGKLKVSGSFKNPAIRGDLSFNKVAFNITKLNSNYIIDNEKISFTSQGIGFDTFTLVDQKGNKAIINGSVFTSNYIDYRFGLDLNTTDFKVLSSTKKDNKHFWGEVFLNSELKILGSIGSPLVEGNIKINKGTSFSIVIPQSAPGIVEREGIVEFVDMDLPQSITYLNAFEDSINTSTLTGMDISVNIEVDSNAVFNIIIDEGSGDFLKIQGDAKLTAGFDQRGKVNLNGAFEVTKGSYELSFNFMKRRFIIEKGSIITWHGTPTSADVNITAAYIANAAPYDLVVSQLTEAPLSLNRYKQKLPFEVILNMSGELMRPLITFNINLPNRNYSVTRDVVDNVQFQLTRLKMQPSELNKQVFALLLLNRFVAENPFVSGAGSSGAESIARSSASKLLSEQINKLAGSLIDGVDLNFDFVSSEDYTSGSLQNRTDLNVGLSKSLINDQLKVSVGSSFELEGPRNANQNATNIAGNVAIDYQLSKDGRYMLRAYRKNEYQGIAEGYLIETGVGFIFTLDYEVFKELFRHKKEEEKQSK